VRNEYLRTRPEVSQVVRQLLRQNKEPVAALGVVHEYFYAQVLQRPDAQAVCAWDGESALPDFMMANMVTVANLDFAKQ
jgi:hypothetical protein